MKLIREWINSRRRDRNVRLSEQQLMALASRYSTAVLTRVSITELISGYRALLDVPESYSELVGFGLLTPLETYFSAAELLKYSRKLKMQIGNDQAPKNFPQETNTYIPAGSLLEFFTDQNQLVDAEWYLSECLAILIDLESTFNDIALCRKDDLAFWERVTAPIFTDFTELLLALAEHYRKVRFSKGAV